MRRLVLLIAATILCSPLYADVIMDNYVGGSDHGYGDVIAGTGDHDFDISSMAVSRSGTTLSVTINTNFGAGSGLGTFASATHSGKGIAFGDLFLSSTGWNPYGSASNGYTTDNASNGTLWDYAVSLDDRWDVNSSASLYALDTTQGNSDVLLTQDFMKRDTYRTGQATAVDTSEAGIALANVASFSATTGQLQFVVDLANTALANAGDIGLHWDMTCGNDTIEGQYSSAVPAPASLFIMLFGVGMLGLGVVRHNRRSSPLV